MKLYKKLPDFVEYKGYEYRINPWFHVILYCTDVIHSNEYSDEEKILYAFDALVDTKFKSMSLRDKNGILVLAFQALFEKSKQSNDKKKIFDFEQDAKYIYAAFMQAYNIDLLDVKELHWWKFISLFNGLPQDTKIMQIIDIRTKPIPKRTKYNSEYITSLMKLKAEYKLEISQEEQEKQMQDFLGNLFNKLKAQAEKR